MKHALFYYCMIRLYNHVNSLFQLLDEDNAAELVTLNEIKGTTVKSKWIFEIFHDEFVYGIRQTDLMNSSKEVGCTVGNGKLIKLMDGEQVIKVTFSGLI